MRKEVVWSGSLRKELDEVWRWRRRVCEELGEVRSKRAQAEQSEVSLSYRGEHAGGGWGRRRWREERREKERES